MQAKDLLTAVEVAHNMRRGTAPLRYLVTREAVLTVASVLRECGCTAAFTFAIDDEDVGAHIAVWTGDIVSLAAFIQYTTSLAAGAPLGAAQGFARELMRNPHIMSPKTAAKRLARKHKCPQHAFAYSVLNRAAGYLARGRSHTVRFAYWVVRALLIAVSDDALLAAIKSL